MMKLSALMLVSMAAISSAQVTANPNGTYICSIPNAAYCAGTTLDTNIIIRCVNGTGQAGNCNDNLAGYAPIGVSWSPCWQSSPTAGDAACSKNGTVYPASGSIAANSTTPFPVPGSVAAGNSSSTNTSLPTITLTTTRTNTHTNTRTNTLHTTITTYISADGSTSSGYWTTYTKLASTTQESVPTSTLTSSTPTSDTPTTNIPTVSIASDGQSTVFTTVGVTVETTICPESSILAAASSSVTSSSQITAAVASFTILSSRGAIPSSPVLSQGSSPTTSSTPSVSATTALVTPTAPIFSIALNSTTINVGPGPVSLASYSTVSSGAASSTPLSSITVAAYNTSSTIYVASVPSTMQSRYGTAFPTQNSTSSSSNATASILAYTGAAVRNVNVNGWTMVAFGVLAAALL